MEKTFENFKLNDEAIKSIEGYFSEIYGDYCTEVDVYRELCHFLLELVGVMEKSGEDSKKPFLAEHLWHYKYLLDCCLNKV